MMRTLTGYGSMFDARRNASVTRQVGGLLYDRTAGLPAAVTWVLHKIRKDLGDYPESDPLRQYLQGELDGLEQQIVDEVGELAELVDRLLKARHIAEIHKRAVAHQADKNALKEQRTLREQHSYCDNADEAEMLQSRLEAARDEGLAMRDQEAIARAAKEVEQANMLARAAAERRIERERKKQEKLQQLRRRLKNV